MACSLGFNKVTALLSALPAICDYTWPRGAQPPETCGASAGTAAAAANESSTDAAAAAANESSKDCGDKPKGARLQKRIYRTRPGAGRAAKAAAEQLRQRQLWQQVPMGEGGGREGGGGGGRREGGIE